jgi:hypothetical protein
VPKVRRSQRCAGQHGQPGRRQGNEDYECVPPVGATKHVHVDILSCMGWVNEAANATNLPFLTTRWGRTLANDFECQNRSF